MPPNVPVRMPAQLAIYGDHALQHRQRFYAISSHRTGALNFSCACFASSGLVDGPCAFSDSTTVVYRCLHELENLPVNSNLNGI